MKHFLSTLIDAFENVKVYKCTKCHHEFEGVISNRVIPVCDWCGSEAREINV